MTQIHFFDRVLAQLRAVRARDLPLIARESGVPESTLRKIRYGEVKDPRVQTVEALHDYFSVAYSVPSEGALCGSSHAGLSRADGGADLNES